jgi:uncharacterized protein
MLKQYLYTLKLIPELMEEKNWSEKENQIVKEHFEALQMLLNANKLILAGKTEGMGESTFGIVIFQAISEEQAISIMKNDPAVKRGIMNAELYPYTVALFNPQFK